MWGEFFFLEAVAKALGVRSWHRLALEPSQSSAKPPNA